MTNEEMDNLCQEYDESWSEEKKADFLKSIDDRPKLDTKGLSRFTQQMVNVREQEKSFLGAFLFFAMASLVLIYITTKLSARYDIR